MGYVGVGGRPAADIRDKNMTRGEEKITERETTRITIVTYFGSVGFYRLVSYCLCLALSFPPGSACRFGAIVEEMCRSCD